jgi:ribosomal-protein-alanine N-acetyltransferase
MAISVAVATFADVDRVAELARELGVGVWTAADYRAETLREDAIFLCAHHPKFQLIGFILGRVVPDTSGPGCAAEIYNLGVAATYRRKGLGSELLRDYLVRCRKSRVNAVWLEVREGNWPARAFYRRHGFREVGTRSNFYTEPDEDAVLMRLRI